MTAIVRSSPDRAGSGNAGRHANVGSRTGAAGSGSIDDGPDQATAAGRPKGWLRRIIEAMKRPAEQTYDNP